MTQIIKPNHSPTSRDKLLNELIYLLRLLALTSQFGEDVISISLPPSLYTKPHLISVYHSVDE